jgi:ribosomal protein S18 acetylase RimI-like enzyme
VRRRTANDDRFIAEIAQRSFSEYSRRADLNTLRMARAGTTWVACREQQVLGFAVVSGAGPASAELSAIAVAEQARGQGVGAALLAGVERALRDEGVRELSLHTAQANASAMDLFLKHGYRVERRLPRFYRGVFDACTMRKQLGAAQH